MANSFKYIIFRAFLLSLALIFKLDNYNDNVMKNIIIEICIHLYQEKGKGIEEKRWQIVLEVHLLRLTPWLRLATKRQHLKLFER